MRPFLFAQLSQLSCLREGRGGGGAIGEATTIDPSTIDPSTVELSKQLSGSRLVGYQPNTLSVRLVTQLPIISGNRDIRDKVLLSVKPLPQEGKMASRKIAPEFTETRNFIREFVAVDDDQADLLAVWAMGTWTFSPASPAMPYTYPYLYVNGPSGSGKTVLGNTVLGSLCRNHQGLAGATGPSLFRTLISIEDDEIINHYPTLAVDEIDATYNGAKDEDLRQVFNIGYKTGTTIPRSAGKVAINYPAFCPKVLMGIDNGHLPETVTNRCIRIDMHVATKAEQTTISDFFPWEQDERAAQLREKLAQWAKDHAMVLRDYNPSKDDFGNRQWEISRSLVQLAHAIGNEKRIREAIKSLFTRSSVKEPVKVRMYRSILSLFDETRADKVTTKAIIAKLVEDGIAIRGNPANPGKGLSAMLAEDGISPLYIFIDGRSHRGYWRHYFDDAFVKYLSADEDDE